ncbi:MAG TPA: ABC transporter permease, partial [Candidatus Deferrimicrobium sp.]|nr:ABC transporter permease [Candidatus Deferrimicrobium sp.]
WVMGLASVVSAKVTVELIAAGQEEVPAIAAGFVVALASAALVGLTSGLIIAKLRVPSFIVTLGMAFIVRGAALIVSGGNTVGGLPDGLRNFGNESLFYWTHGEGGGLAVLYRPDVAGDSLRSMDRVLPWPVLVTAVTVGVAMFLLNKTQFGRHTYAIGGNREASVRAGVPADRMTILIFTLSAITAGMAGILYTARFSGGSAIAGDPLLLNSIAAVIIGGVSMFGGRGNIIGTVIGSLIIAILVTGLIMLQVDPFWQWVVVGIVVILAVVIDQARDLVVGRAESQ